MKFNLISIIFLVILGTLLTFVLYKNSRQSNLSQNRELVIETTPTSEIKHSVPLEEILSGGPPKDGIPSIDNPKFLFANEGDKFLENEEPGTGLCVGSVCRFYPYQILVWHEIVNDVVGGQPALITYCPLCATGIVYERKLEGKAVQFGTSGKLWKSNLVMYNRAGDPKKESLWSQVLGEAIVGEFTGTKLKIIPSDVIQYGNWKKLHPETKVLSKDTGFIRRYGYDPYGDYYTSNDVSFGATFNDKRLPPKEFVLGVNVDGKFKAYPSSVLKIGETTDIFNGVKIAVIKKPEGEVRMFRGADRQPLPYIGAFWFSWLNAHPDTALFK